MRDAILEARLPGPSKLVLLAVVAHRSSESPEPFVSVRRLAELASVNKDTPARVVAALERAGLLLVRRGNERAPARFDLGSLPLALARLLSEQRGQPEEPDLSEPEGQRCPDSGDNGAVRHCPNGGDRLSEPEGQASVNALSPQTSAAVPANETAPPESVPAVRTQGSDQGTGKEHLAPTGGAGVAPLELTATERKSATPRGRGRKPESAPDPRLLPLRDYYVAEYCRANAGAEPALSSRHWGRAMRALADLLEAAGSDERARLCIARTFADDWRRRRRCQPWHIAEDANVLLADAGARKAWVQRGGEHAQAEARRARAAGDRLVTGGTP
ncbi:MAG: hypothetical protein IPM35_04250 [Myxococcales bacterium]|nr:hypothetical protein [Myxococcales bacterium]